jgi:hypothetical protein
MWQCNKVEQKGGFLTYCGLIGYKIMQPVAVLPPSRLWYENLPN